MLSLVFKFYRFLLSPFLHAFSGPGFGCRFEPSCSQFAEQAIQRHGWPRGLVLTLGRLIRCHPFSNKAGYDPVP